MLNLSVEEKCPTLITNKTMRSRGPRGPPGPPGEVNDVFLIFQSGDFQFSLGSLINLPNNIAMIGSSTAVQGTVLSGGNVDLSTFIINVMLSTIVSRDIVITRLLTYTSLYVTGNITLLAGENITFTYQIYKSTGTNDIYTPTPIIVQLIINGPVSYTAEKVSFIESSGVLNETFNTGDLLLLTLDATTNAAISTVGLDLSSYVSAVYE